LIGDQGEGHFAKRFSRVHILIYLGVGEASPSHKHLLICPEQIHAAMLEPLKLLIDNHSINQIVIETISG
jgi:hypothetical protein